MEHVLLQHIVKLTLFWQSFELLDFFSLLFIQLKLLIGEKSSPNTQGTFYCRGKDSLVTHTFIWTEKAVGELLLTSDSAASGSFQWTGPSSIGSRCPASYFETIPGVENTSKCDTLMSYL